MILHRSARLVATSAAVVLVVGGAACTEAGTEKSSRGSSSTTSASPCSPDDLFACAQGSTIEDYLPAEPTSATGQPIALGMINQENTPGGSYPELSQADQAAIEFINTELGGVDGRPLELEVCNTKFSAEGSQACAQTFVQQGYPAVLGAVDVFGNGIDVLADNGIPFVGGIPISTQSVTSPSSFQFSGGTWGATVAFANYAATELEAKRVATIYLDFGSIKDAALYGDTVLEANGVESTLIPIPVISTDLVTPFQAANADNPDAIVVLTADAGCAAALNAAASLQLTAQLFFTGACAAPKILDEAGDAKTDGMIINVEGPLDTGHPDPDTALYFAVVEKYGDGLDAQGAATVSFRALMNFYVILRELGADNITPDSIIEALRRTKDTPSFTGYPYTCDGEQFEALPAVCSPQQILAKRTGGSFEAITDWLQVGEIYATALEQTSGD